MQHTHIIFTILQKNRAEAFREDDREKVSFLLMQEPIEYTINKTIEDKSMILNLKDAFDKVNQISDEVIKEIFIYILNTLNNNPVNNEDSKEDSNELKEKK